MKRHISIDIKSALANDLSVMEWCLLECIHFSSNNETGYCYASKESLREHIGVSNGQIYKMIENLVNRGLLKKHKDTGHLKTTEKWVEIERGDTLQKMENDSPENGDDSIQKMEPLTIKGEDEGRREDKKTSKKEIVLTQSKTDAKEVAEYLAHNITAYKPNAKPKPASWVNDIEAAIRIDGRTKQELIACIDWIYRGGGDFWIPNIMSGKKLRDKYDQLEMQAKRGNHKKPDAMQERIAKMAAEGRLG